MTPFSDQGLESPQLDRLLDMSDAVTATPGRQSHPTPPFLAADVGGTHARIGLVMPDPATGRADIVLYEVYRCAEFASLTAILRRFCADHNVQPDALVLACAGFVEHGVVINESLAWPVLLDSLRDDGGFARVDVLNDFEAFAHAVGPFGAQNSTVIVDGVANPHGPVAIIGPGTGLGAALWLPGQPSRVLPTEAGHMELAARPGIEQAIRAQLGPADGYVPYDRVLSGPGLLRLYRALAAVQGVPATFTDPGEITAMALAGMDTLATQTVDQFCRWLGAFCGDVAIAFSASGGVCLAGGFLARITNALRAGPFTERFLDKGVMRSFLNNTPVFVVEHGQLGVLGAANWRLQH